MSSFTEATFSKVDGAFRDGRQVWVADQDFYFYIGTPNPEIGARIGVKKGFTTDFASIPAKAWKALDVALWFLPRKVRQRIRDWIEGQLAKAAALHDRMREDLQYVLMDSDAAMLMAMHADKVWKPLKWTVFFAVRTNKSRRAWNGAGHT